MNLNAFTEKAQQAIVEGQTLAEKQQHPQFEPEHLLLTLVEQRDGIVAALLRALSAEPSQVAAALRGELARLASSTRSSAATRRSAASSRSCPAAPRTTPC
jgi:ATP-dependent Clp protease ATP-binding subunit ClpB